MRRCIPILLILCGVVCGAGCATTPKVAEVVRETPRPPGPPRIVSTEGLLPPAQSKALIERLEHAGNPSDMLERQIAVMEAVSGTPLSEGNKAELLIDGPATYAAIFKAIGDARDHINLESYEFEDVTDKATGERLSDLLLRKQAAGVRVNLIYDSVGSIGTPAALFKRLRDGGVQVVQFNPVNPLRAHGQWRLTHRDHRKILVVDGAVAITGGINISKVYTGEKENERIPWRDTDVRIEGPAVAELQKLFIDTWHREKGPELARRDYFPPPEEKGKALIEVAGNTPGELNRLTFIMYASALTFAEKSAHLTAAFFVPDRQTLHALTDAAGRGVDVKLVLPRKSPSWLALNAGRYHYAELLQAGVMLCERRDAVLHAKTAVIDGVWSTIGSTNMDFLSFAKNDEVNAIILDRPFAAEMERMFARDLENCDRILPERWGDRSLFARIGEWIAHLFSGWL